MASNRGDAVSHLLVLVLGKAVRGKGPISCHARLADVDLNFLGSVHRVTFDFQTQRLVHWDLLVHEIVIHLLLALRAVKVRARFCLTKGGLSLNDLTLQGRLR